ncbi:MAG: transglycosylase SLT domain-containing protein, partial [Gemmatimonadetes bacterium]|nr:transglycosylase SLT domain-containing protein [Gemmatimonadota bacterium]
MLVSFALLTGCGTLVGVPPAAGPTPGPQPVHEPPAEGAPEARIPVPLEAPVRPSATTATLAESRNIDPILDSPWAQTEEMDAKVQEWIESFKGRESSTFRNTLARMGRFEPMVEGHIRAAGLPASLAYLPIVESWYKPGAVSWVGAAGLWQFMPPTARGMGLKVNRLIDERRDPYLSTPLALQYLAELHAQFGSWFLALAAYNGGPGRLDRILRRYNRGEVTHDGLFMEVLQQLPRETRNFVPRFLAAARIGSDPAAFGFEDLVKEAPLGFEEIEVPDATSMDVIARASQVDQETLEELNPQLLRGLTPAGVSTILRVPQGAGARFSAAYAQIPLEERVTFLEHSVSSGETLTHIARRYGVPVADLQATNPTIQPRRMQIGQRVVVPKAPSVRDQLRVGNGGPSNRGGERSVVYEVRPGDTL